MHRSRINGLLIDCKTDDIDAAAQFWADALGRPVDMKHPGTRGNYRMLETPPDELSVQVQRVDHESRVHIDIETDDIQAEVQGSKNWVPRWTNARSAGRSCARRRASVSVSFGCSARIGRKTPINGTDMRLPPIRLVQLQTV